MTSGRNTIRQAIAAIISGVGLPAWLVAPCAVFSTSLSATTEPSAVFLVIEITRLVNGGTARRIACGSSTHCMDCHHVRPVERAASICPAGTARIPAHTLSSAEAASTSDSDNQVTAKADSGTPSEGKPKYSTMITTRGDRK